MVTDCANMDYRTAPQQLYVRPPLSKPGGTTRKSIEDDRLRARRQATKRAPHRRSRSSRQARRRPVLHEHRYRETKRITNASAVSATSRQPLSMTSQCPRLGISMISVTVWLRFCRL